MAPPSTYLTAKQSNSERQQREHSVRALVMASLGPPRDPSRGGLLLSFATHESLFGTRKLHFGPYKWNTINSNYAIY